MQELAATVPIARRLAPPGPRALLPAAAGRPGGHAERVTLGDEGQQASLGQRGPPLAEVRWYHAAAPRPPTAPVRLLRVGPGDALARLAEPQERTGGAAVHAHVEVYRRTMEWATT